MSMIPESKVNRYLTRYAGATKAELRSLLQTAKGKPKTTEIQAEIKAIKTLLA